MTKKIVVIGASLSGLTAAYFLKQKGYNVVVLEKTNRVGGFIETQSENGFIFDKGFNSFLESSAVVPHLIDELNLQNQVIYANKTANKRYILKNNRLHALPINTSAILKSKLFSIRAKTRLLIEPFVGKSNDGYYQSVGEFITRRLGSEILDYAFNPFVAEVYAGNPESLSVKSAFPKLYALEEEYGGLIVGTFKSIRKRKFDTKKDKVKGRMFSFKNGMSVLCEAFAKKIGDSLLLNTEAKKIRKIESGYKIDIKHDDENHSIESDIIISAVPAHAAVNLFDEIDVQLKKHFNDIYYPPLFVQYLAYKREDVLTSLDALGIFIPSKERKSFLYSLWNSSIFPNRSAEGTVSFTIFTGGARDPDILTLDKELLLMKIRGEFETIMKINNEPVYSSYKYWANSIPQYKIGHIDLEKYFQKFEENNPGLFLVSNYRGGVSIGDSIKNAANVAEKIEKLITNV